MAATFSLTKRGLFNISKSLPKDHPYCVQSRLSRPCLISTSFEPAQDPRNRPPTEASCRHEGKGGREVDANIDNTSSTGVTGFVADTAGEGAATVQVAEDLADLAKETTNFAWDSAKKSTQKVSDTLVAEADENVVDMTDYRNIEDQSHSADHEHNNHKGS